MTNGLANAAPTAVLPEAKVCFAILRCRFQKHRPCFCIQHSRFRVHRSGLQIRRFRLQIPRCPGRQPEFRLQIPRRPGRKRKARFPIRQTSPPEAGIPLRDPSMSRPEAKMSRPDLSNVPSGSLDVPAGSENVASGGTADLPRAGCLSACGSVMGHHCFLRRHAPVAAGNVLSPAALRVRFGLAGGRRRVFSGSFCKRLSISS